MFFARAGVYEACGIFSVGHWMLVLVTFFCVCLAWKESRNKSKDEVLKIIRVLTVAVWLLELMKISFNLQYFKIYNVKEWIPLYYCSILLYAGFLSSFTKGPFKRAGDAFLATGSIVGGLVFIIMPTTSLPTYPAFHFISFHSFFFHGTMVYLTLLVNSTRYVELNKKDIFYFAALVGVVCLAALYVNNRFHSNLMFISKNFPRTPIEPVYKFTGKLFTPLMIVGQMLLPFYIPYFCIWLFSKNNKKKRA